MKKVRSWEIVTVLCLGALPLFAQAPTRELKLGAGMGTLGGTVTVPLLLSAPESNIEGLVSVFEWDGENGMGVGLDIPPGSAIAAANAISMRTESSYMALGVVMDNDGSGGEIIPPGVDQELARVSIRCLGNEGVFPIRFVDGAHALAGENPKLDNIVVEGGLSVGAGEGLALVDGSFECNGDMAELELRLGSATGAVGALVNVPLTLNAPMSEIQGLVAAFEWNGDGGRGEDLVPGTAIAQADLVNRRVEDDYMVLGVVMDSDGQDGEVIPPTTDADVATAVIRCGDAEGIFGVTLVDGKYAAAGEEPKLNNIVVEGGLSIGVNEGLTLTHGSFECTGDARVPVALRLGTAAASFGGLASVPLLLDSPAEDSQGLVAVFEWDEAGGGAESLTPSPAIDGEDLVAMRVDAGANFMVLGVVMDSDGQDGEVISAGEDIEIAVAGIRCGGVEGVFAIEFVDDKYAMVGDSPTLTNLVVFDGFSLGVGEGLALEAGSFECSGEPAPPGELRVENGENDPLSGGDLLCGDARVLMTNNEAVDGYVIALCHDPDTLSLSGIQAGAAAIDNGADFVQEEILNEGGTLGVVLDLVAPFEGNLIPPGSDQHVATYTYCCVNPPAEGEAEQVTALTLCDGILGSPTKENVLVVDGLSQGVPEGLVLTDGEFICKPIPRPAVEICDNGIDDDLDGLIDCDDPDCFDDEINCPPSVVQRFACGSCEVDDNGDPLPIKASIGSTFPVCFYVQSPEDNEPGHQQFDHIQGFTMSVEFCCDLTSDGEIDVSGTIVEAVEADFVDTQIDNDPDDGDGCELIISVLVDAMPPFNGATIPPLPEFQSIGSVDFTVKDGVECGSICDIAFVDGLNGAGIVPVKNLISVENESLPPDTVDCAVEVTGTPVFFRGDCNFSGEGMGMAVNIADAAAGVSFLFLPDSWQFEPPCLDACDCNDDGRLDLADVLCILRYAVQSGPFPPAPGSGLEETGEANPAVRPTPPGIDPTEDKLDCAGGVVCPQ
jgi:hypothetical protein